MKAVLVGLAMLAGLLIGLRHSLLSDGLPTPARSQRIRAWMLLKRYMGTVETRNSSKCTGSKTQERPKVFTFIYMTGKTNTSQSPVLLPK